jgi:hypothetical protein
MSLIKKTVLLSYNLTNPSSPGLDGSSRTDLDQPNNIVVSGNYAYITDYDNGLVIFDVNNPLFPGGSRDE